MLIEVFGDGSATVKGSAGGWGCVIMVDGQLYSELSGHSNSATNNDMELEAAIQGLSCALSLILKMAPACMPDVTLCSDSQLVLGWANGSFKFKQLDKMPMYLELLSLVKKMNVKTQWIKGHSKHPINDRCDKLANLARKGLTESKDPVQVKNQTESRIGTKKSKTASVWFDGILRVLDFESGIIENYCREAHGKRGSMIEIRGDKNR